MNTRQMCPLLSCHYHVTIYHVISLLLPNVCLACKGQTLNMLLLVKCCSFSQKCDKKVTELLFFSYFCILFTIFLRMSLQKVCQNYLGTKSTFKAAQKLTPGQFCSKNALNKTIFLKNGKFGTHAIVVSFLSCFFHESQISF